jgi:hypothetical protein
MKLDPNGETMWSRRFGAGASDARSNGVAVDNKGRVAIAGSMVGNAAFGSITLSGSGGSDAFAALLDAGGEIVWVKRWGDDADQEATAIAFDNDQAVIVVVGDFAGSIDFGGGALASKGAADAFIAAFSASGSPEGHAVLGGSATQRALGVSVTNHGETFVTGELTGSAAFAGHELVAAGGSDAFMLSIALNSLTP